LKQRFISMITAIIAMLILILDTKTAARGVSEGISVCMQTIIPSLFPFFLISKLLSGSLSGKQIKLLRPIARICSIPEGFESTLAIGFLGGYPIGAHIIGDAYRSNRLTCETASRILPICNNAGPAFIFGMTAFLFRSVYIGWCIWLIQILSALMVGIMLPGKASATFIDSPSKPPSLVSALEGSVRNMGILCGWVVIFRVILTYLIKWFAFHSASVWKAILTGSLELSNGCLYLSEISSPAMRFIIINGLLSFGGICVLMQTRSVTHGLRLRTYFMGKFLQSHISTILSVITQYLIFPGEVLQHGYIIIFMCLFSISVQFMWVNRKKIVDYWNKIMYNKRNENRNEA